MISNALMYCPPVPDSLRPHLDKAATLWATRFKVTGEGAIDILPITRTESARRIPAKFAPVVREAVETFASYGFTLVLVHAHSYVFVGVLSKDKSTITYAHVNHVDKHVNLGVTCPDSSWFKNNQYRVPDMTAWEIVVRSLPHFLEYLVTHIDPNTGEPLNEY